MADGTYTTPEDEALFSALGRHTLSWSFIEAATEYMVFAIHTWGSGHTIEKEMPWSLERKLTYLRKAFRRLPRLISFSEAAFPILNDIKSASDIRHDLIHGIATEHIEGANEIRMTRILRGKTTRTLKEFSVSTTEILQAAVEAQKIGSKSLYLATRVIAALAPAD
jgi:hypothetical protein